MFSTPLCYLLTYISHQAGLCSKSTFEIKTTVMLCSFLLTKIIGRGKEECHILVSKRCGFCMKGTSGSYRDDLPLYKRAVMKRDKGCHLGYLNESWSMTVFRVQKCWLEANMRQITNILTW